ncbi:MAG: MFS transporter [Gammaproteobacteria bacterium]|nr:MFS transporter [Gammaproteobacteria bacterium]
MAEPERQPPHAGEASVAAVGDGVPNAGAPVPGAWSVFRIRSYRYQWLADLLTSWAFEMEILILGWFVLVRTDSPFLVSLLGAMHYGGTLLSPVIGMVADRVSRRTLLVRMRAFYASLAASLMLIGLLGEVQTWHVFVVAALSGLVKPSDIVLRNALIADTVPGPRLQSAMGLSRTTMDSARMFGSLVGAGLFSALGMGLAYGAVTGFYVAACLSTLGVAHTRLDALAVRAHPWHDLKAGLAYMRRSPELVGIMLLAFLVNLTAYPVTHGLLPVVARGIYGVDENGLARLVACFALGALVGSLMMALVLKGQRPGRTTCVFTIVWHVLLTWLAFTQTAQQGMLLLVMVGMSQSLAMISLAILLLRLVEPAYRGRLMGVRILAVYGLPLGLLLAGTLAELLSVVMTMCIFGVTGIVLSIAIMARWRSLLQ